MDQISVYLFRKQNPCPLNLSGNNLQQLSIFLILGGQVELNPGPKAKYPCQICNRAVKWGQKGIACDNCDLWYHQTCMSMNSDTYLRLANTSIAWLCKVCNTPNHSSVLYTSSIMSDDNQFSSLSGNETNSVNNDNLSSLNNSISTINSPLASSSPKQHNTNETTRASKDTLRILNINIQSIRNKKALLHNLVETTETDIIIGTETWLNNSIHSSEIIPTDQYNIFRNDREGSKGGGVLIVVHNSIICSELFKSNNTELIAVKSTTTRNL